MKRTLLVLAILFVSAASFAQAKPEMKLNTEGNLIEATYFYANGEVSQKGTFNLEKRLHGEWMSYNKKGETISIGFYNNGEKSGKWFFWDNDILREVEYNKNVIAAVTETKSTEGIVNRN